jgi:hypothetical protein
MFWPVVAFTGARRTHVDDILRHTRPQALINGHGYWRCIATVWHWEYPVQIACRFLGGICFHLDEDDVGFWRFLTSSIDSCNFGGRVPRPLLVATAASFFDFNQHRLFITVIMRIHISASQHSTHSTKRSIEMRFLLCS